jgi:hypothetical protein
VIYRLAADGVVVFHLAFICFAVLGGWLVLLRGLRWAWLHLPACAWGVWIELSHGICPLTPLENGFRHHAGESGYSGDFIDHYLIPLIYPPGLQPQHQLLLGTGLLGMNLSLYAIALLRHWRKQSQNLSP